MLLGVLIAGIVVGRETILVVLTLVTDAVVLVTAVAGGIVEAIVVVELGKAVDTTVPFGYWQPHNTKPLGQEPTL